jgi:hypothetical protein
MKNLVILAFILWSTAAYAQTFASQTFTGSATTQIQAQIPTSTGLQRHTVMIQACSSNTANVDICFNTNNACTAATAAFELAPGGSFGPITFGMYTGMTQSTLTGAQIFNADIAFLPLSGTQCVHALID